MRGVHLLLLATACFDPKYQSPSCGPAGECPSGLTCIDGTCRVPTVDADVDSPPIDVMVDGPPGSMTLFFQHGVNGYLGGEDTYIDEGSPDSDRGNDTNVRWRATNRWALLDFENIVGAGAIPPSATILSATLRLVIGNAGPGDLRECSAVWTPATTYSTFGPVAGVQSDDLGPSVAMVANTSGPQTFDVKSTIERWITGAFPKRGWIIVPVAGGGGDASFRSNEEGLVANRPLLTVTFYP